MQKKLLCVAFILILVLVPALTLCSVLRAPAGWSVEENRALAGLPELSLEALWDGQSAEEAEGFFKDHIYARSALLKLSVRLQMEVLRRPVVQDVVLGGQALLPVAEIEDYWPTNLAAKAERMAQSLAEIEAVTEEVGGRFCYVLIPEQRSALRAYYPAWMENRAGQYDAIRTAFVEAMETEGVMVLDLFDTYQEAGDLTQYYSVVDHHYTLRGAGLAYEVICDALELEYAAPEIVQTERNFSGTYSRKLYGLSPVSERFQTDVAETVPYQRWDNGEQTDRALIEIPEEGDCYYTAYMGGDIAETIVQTNRTELGKVLVVGDSFTNALETLLYRSFGEMRSLDFRHYSGMSLSDYIRAYEPDLVLVVRDDISCLTIGGNGGLE